MIKGIIYKDKRSLVEYLKMKILPEDKKKILYLYEMNPIEFKNENKDKNTIKVLKNSGPISKEIRLDKSKAESFIVEGKFNTHVKPLLSFLNKDLDITICISKNESDMCAKSNPLNMSDYIYIYITFECLNICYANKCKEVIPLY